jgi:DNA-binding FadR family transcriptional regulator
MSRPAHSVLGTCCIAAGTQPADRGTVPTAASPRPSGSRAPEGAVSGGRSRGGANDKLAATLARRIEDEIEASQWPVGAVVGTEAELMVRYGVSRAVFREAVRLVEHHRVAHMRRGPGGGLVVQTPDVDGAATALVIYLERAGTSVANLMDVRLILEPLAVSLAAQRLTEDGIRTLRHSVAQEVGLGVAGQPSRLPDHVHHAIAEMSENAILRLFLDILDDLSGRFAARPRGMSKAEASKADRDVREEHRGVVDAIIEGNVGLAQQLAIEHLEAIRSLLLNSARNTRAWPVRRVAPVQDSDKLAAVLAEDIRRDVALAGRDVGSVIGSESEILLKYGVSRQILREAVRLLEHHGVATMRRGPGGGLTVAQSDPWASIEAISVYLQHQSVDVADLRAVRNAIELACIDQVVGRKDDPEVARQLRAALDTEHAKSTAELVASVHDVHRKLAELTGNPVLSLFLNVLTSLWERRSVHCAPDVPPADSQVLQSLQEAHGGIVDAVLAGDRGLARHRMLRHVEELTDWWH